jgi:hypothetical protein
MEVIGGPLMRGGTVSGLTMLGSITTSPGVHGNSAKFDVVSAVNFGWARDGCFLSPNLCPNGFALSVWLYDSGTKTSETYYISSGGQTSSSYGFAILKKNTHRVDVKTKSHWYRCNFVISTQKWTHVVVTWYDNPVHAVDALYVYVDGTRVPTSITVVTKVFLGNSVYNLITFGSPNNGNNTGLFVQASIDEFMFWNEWKSAAFVKELRDTYTGWSIILHHGWVNLVTRTNEF